MGIATLGLALSANAANVKLGAAGGALVFEPAEVTIKSGETVTWTNNIGFPHNVVFDEDNIPVSSTSTQKLQPTAPPWGSQIHSGIVLCQEYLERCCAAMGGGVKSGECRAMSTLPASVFMSGSRLSCGCTSLRMLWVRHSFTA